MTQLNFTQNAVIKKVKHGQFENSIFELRINDYISKQPTHLLFTIEPYESLFYGLTCFFFFVISLLFIFLVI